MTCTTCKHWHRDTRKVSIGLCRERALDGLIIAHTHEGLTCRKWAKRQPKRRARNGHQNH